MHAIQTHLGNIFASTPLAILQPERRSPGRLRRRRCCEPGSVCSAIFCRAAWWIWWASIRRIRRPFKAACWARPAERPSRRGAQQRHRRDGRGEPDVHFRVSRRASYPARRRSRIPAACLQPVAITAVPDGKLRAPYFMQWSFALEQQIGTSVNLRAQYVGTRAVNQPYETQVNGYQTVCQGCFAPFPYGQPADPRFGAVTQLNTGANSHYNGLQLTADKRLGARASGAGELHLEPLHGHGFERRISAVFRGRDSLAAARRTRRDNTVLAITMCGTTSPRNTSISCRSRCGTRRWVRRQWMAGVGHRVLAQRRSVFGVEHAVFGEWGRHCAGQRSAICQRGSGCASL